MRCCRFSSLQYLDELKRDYEEHNEGTKLKNSGNCLHAVISDYALGVLFVAIIWHT